MTRPVEPWRRRIVDHADADPRTLIPHPLNPRMHPLSQRQALSGVLDEIGWLQDVIVNRTTGRMIDGHARREQAIEHNEPTVPVTYVELTEDEEAIALATFDPLGTLAVIDDARMQDLLARADADNEHVKELLAQLAESVRAPDAGDPFADLVTGGAFNTTNIEFEIVAGAIDAAHRDRITTVLSSVGIDYEVRTMRSTT